MSNPPANLLRQPGHFTSPRVTNFYYSFLFLPREKRRAIEAVYSFARHGDDLADGQLIPDRARKEIARYRQLLDWCYGEQSGEFDQQPVLAALAEAIHRFNIPRKPFEDLILGLEMDLSLNCYETFEDLAVYCYRVASTIGLISIEIFGYQNPRTRDYAVKLGTALQLVNIMRDVKSDARRGRIYIPKEDLDRFAIQPGEIIENRYQSRFVELMKFQAARARRYFSEARQLLAPEDSRSMIAAEIMAAIYWRILRRIENRQYNVFEERIRLAQPLKLWVALTVYLGADWQR